jgi:hypothetical protein
MSSLVIFLPGTRNAWPWVLFQCRMRIFADYFAEVLKTGSDAGLGDSFSHAARATGVAIMVSNSTGVKRPNAA